MRIASAYCGDTSLKTPFFPKKRNKNERIEFVSTGVVSDFTG
jgi:hypothetical protein